MNINKLDLFKSVMTFMEPQMNVFGFKKSFSKQWFTKDKDANFKLAYSFTYFEKFDIETKKVGVAIEPHLSIYNIPIEQLFLQITTRIGIKLFQLKTIGNSVANIKANPSGDYIKLNNHIDIFIFSEEDAESTAKSLMEHFEKTALPYYEQFSNWLGLDSIFNNTLDTCKSSVHCLIQAERDMRGLILAKLLNRSDLDELIHLHSKRMQVFDDEDCMVEYQRVLKLLPKIEPLFSTPEEGYKV